ncbi:hypothetical protein GF312_06600 [Candidatus Poribacteria bacterium]|nr:hypothetical protein [Candidatus Poribacteria bacterium]
MNLRFFVLFMVFTFLISIPVFASINDGLIGYWPMDEGSGDKVADASGNGNDGTANGVQWVDGKYNKALEFDGATSNVDIPYFAEVTPAQGTTIAVWVFPTDDTRSCVVGQFEAYGMALFTGLQLKSVIWGDDWVEATATIPLNEWSHLAMTWDQENAERMMFVNGEMVAHKEGALPVPEVQNNLGIGVWIGWPEAWGDDWFMGIIDDVRLWNRVLSADEVGQATEPAAVKPEDKLTTLWSGVKTSL